MRLPGYSPNGPAMPRQATALSEPSEPPPPPIGRQSRLLVAQAFDPESGGYDYASARGAGMGPDGTGENAGHWGSVRQATEAERKTHGLPEESYLLLKGRSHETWDKAVSGEQERGFKVIKRGSRYFSVPNDFK